jgi:hybrid cluster-associated redox disulfide protein
MLWGSMTTFHKDMSITAALEAHPGARAIFERHGMSCCLCLGASSESVEAGSIMHSVSADEIVEELNQLKTETT